MADRIVINGIEAVGHHGVLPSEKRDGQIFRADVTCWLCFPQSDDLSLTADYADIATRVHRILTGPPRDLIETVANDCARDILRVYTIVNAVEVTIHKPQAPISVAFQNVSVTACRRRDQLGDVNDEDLQASSADHSVEVPRSDPVEANPRPRAVLSIGSNIGDREAHLQSVIDFFAPHIVATSRIFETVPWGGVEQQPFLNAVVIIEPQCSPAELLAQAQSLENMARRTRDQRWGPRTLDVDIVDYDGFTSSDPTLTVPHPWAYQRAFVLIPWLDVDPRATLNGVPVRDLVAALDPRDVEGVIPRETDPH